MSEGAFSPHIRPLIMFASINQCAVSTPGLLTCHTLPLPFSSPAASQVAQPTTQRSQIHLVKPTPAKQTDTD